MKKLLLTTAALLILLCAGPSPSVAQPAPTAGDYVSKDFDRCSQSDSGKRLNLELHLLGIRSEMEAWKKRKLAESGRGIAGIRNERAVEYCYS